MKRFFFILSFVFVAALGAAFAQSYQIFASNYPLSYFSERISGYEVVMPEMDGDPAFWEPSVEDIIAMQEADVIVLNGAAYESWLTYVSLPASKIVATSEGFKDSWIVVEESSTHSHGPEGEHSHSGTAFTTWIDFSQAVMQAAVIKDALIALEPAQESTFEENFKALEDDLQALDQALLDLTQGHSSLALVASHPVYQYFARRYQLNLQSVLWEPDGFPEEAQWQELESLLEEHPATWMLWEDTPLPESVARLEELGVRSVVFAPVGNRPSEGDFLEVMQENLENLGDVFATP